MERAFARQYLVALGFPGVLDGEEFICSAGDQGLTHGSGRSSGKKNATHFSILSWRIPWTEKPGGLQTIGPQRVKYVRITNHTHTRTFSGPTD